MHSCEQTIEQFMQAWNRRKLDEIMAFFGDNAEYCNIPMGPAHVGKQAIRAFIEGFLSNLEHIEFRVHQQLCNEHTGVVMNERTDYLKLAGTTIALPVMGVFELRDGRIEKWRDYFDMGLFAEAQV